MAIFYIANGQMLNIERTLCGVHCWIVHNVNRLHKEQLNETEWYRTMWINITQKKFIKKNKTKRNGIQKRRNAHTHTHCMIRLLPRQCVSAISGWIGQYIHKWQTKIYDFMIPTMKRKEQKKRENRIILNAKCVVRMRIYISHNVFLTYMNAASFPLFLCLYYSSNRFAYRSTTNTCSWFLWLLNGEKNQWRRS